MPQEQMGLLETSDLEFLFIYFPKAPRDFTSFVTLTVTSNGL